MGRWQLIPKILELSVSKEWDGAKLEWKLDNIYFDDPDSCLCSHYPIIEHCVIKNIINGNCVIEIGRAHV